MIFERWKKKALLVLQLSITLFSFGVGFLAFGNVVQADCYAVFQYHLGPVKSYNGNNGQPLTGDLSVAPCPGVKLYNLSASSDAYWSGPGTKSTLSRTTDPIVWNVDDTTGNKTGLRDTYGDGNPTGKFDNNYRLTSNSDYKYYPTDFASFTGLFKSIEYYWQGGYSGKAVGGSLYWASPTFTAPFVSSNFPLDLVDIGKNIIAEPNMLGNYGVDVQSVITGTAECTDNLGVLHTQPISSITYVPLCITGTHPAANTAPFYNAGGNPEYFYDSGCSAPTSNPTSVVPLKLTMPCAPVLCVPGSLNCPPPGPDPTVKLYVNTYNSTNQASPIPVNIGSTPNLTWTSSNTLNCTGVGFNTNDATNNLRGVPATNSVYAFKSYTIDCKGINGKIATETVYVKPADPFGVIATPGVCGSNEINLSWPAPNGGVTPYGYAIFRDDPDGAKLPNPLDYNDRDITTKNPFFKDKIGLYNQYYTDRGIDYNLTPGTHTYYIKAFYKNTNGADPSFQYIPVTGVTVSVPSSICAPNQVTLTFNGRENGTSNQYTNLVNIPYSSSVELQWSTTGDPTSCTASVDWSGAQNYASGQTYKSNTGVLNAKTPYTYTLSCTNGTSTDTKSVVVNVGPSQPGTPTNSFSCPSTMTITWSASNLATGYKLYDTGSLVATVPSSVCTSTTCSTVINATTGFSHSYRVMALNLSGIDSPLSQSSPLIWPSCPLPSVGLQLRPHLSGAYSSGPITVVKGGTVDLRWTTNAIVNSCVGVSGPTAQPQWDGFRNPRGGTVVDGPLNADQGYSITCQDSIGTKVVNSVLVIVKPPPVVSCSANPINGNVGDTITWTANVAPDATAPYPYTYTWSGTDGLSSVSTVSADTNSVPFTYSSNGLKTANVSVRDSLGQITSVSCTAPIITPPLCSVDLKVRLYGTSSAWANSVIVPYNTRIDLQYSGSNPGGLNEIGSSVPISTAWNGKSVSLSSPQVFSAPDNLTQLNYIYSLQCSDSVGGKTASVTAKVTPQVPTFPVGGGLTVSNCPAPLSLTISWNPSALASSYDVRDMADNPIALGVTGNSVSIFSGVVEGSIYRFKVRANNVNGPSLYATTNAVSTPRCNPDLIATFDSAPVSGVLYPGGAPNEYLAGNPIGLAGFITNQSVNNVTQSFSNRFEYSLGGGVWTPIPTSPATFLTGLLAGAGNSKFVGSSGWNPGVGTYSVRLCADVPAPFPAIGVVTESDENNCVNLATNIVVRVSSLTCSVSVSPSGGTTSTLFGWSATASGGVAPYSYSWSGGPNALLSEDGLSGTGINPIQLPKTYPTNGLKTATMIVTDSLGNSTSCLNKVIVSTIPQCSVALKISPYGMSTWADSITVPYQGRVDLQWSGSNPDGSNETGVSTPITTLWNGKSVSLSSPQTFQDTTNLTQLNYIYNLQCHDTFGIKLASVTANVKPQDPSCPASGCLATPSCPAPLTLNLTWNGSALASTYEVQDTFGNIIGTNISGTSLPIMGAVEGSFYQFKIRAKNMNGWSAFKLTNSISTPVCASSDLTATINPVVGTRLSGGQPFEYKPNTVISLSGVILNSTARAITKSFSNEFQFSTDLGVTWNPIYAAPDPFATGLGLGSATAVTNASTWIPPVGKYMVKLCADRPTPGAIIESDEANNCSVPLTFCSGACGPLTISCSATPASGGLGTTFVWSASAVGGTPPYVSYAWTGGPGATDNLPTTNSASVNKIYTTTGFKSAKVSVTDSGGTTVQSLPCTANVILGACTLNFDIAPHSSSAWGSSVIVPYNSSIDLRYSGSNPLGGNETGTSVPISTYWHNKSVSLSSVTVFPDGTNLTQASYDFKLQCTDTYGGQSKTVSAYVTPKVPTVTATPSATCPAKVTVTWPASALATSYQIYYKGGVTPIATVSGSTLSYTDNSVVGSSFYQYEVRAVNSNGSSLPGQSSVVSTPTCVSPNPVPTCSVSPASGVVGTNFTWSASTVGGTAPYTYSWTGSSAPLNTVTPSSSMGGITSNVTYTTTGLKSGIITVTDSMGKTSGAVTCTTNADVNTPPPSTVVPTCSASPSSVTAGSFVDWSASATGGTPPYNYIWNGGSAGVVGAGQNKPGYSYGSSGTYTASVTAIDSSNTQGVGTCSVVVQPLSCVPYSFTPGPITAVPGLCAPGSVPPPPGILDFSLVSTIQDKSGGNTFAPGNGSDWGFNATFNLASPKTITAMQITGGGETWSTSNFVNYAIVVFDAGVQLNNSYGQTFAIPAGSKTLTLYSQKWSQTFNPAYTLTVTFSDGTTLSSTVQPVVFTSITLTWPHGTFINFNNIYDSGILIATVPKSVCTATTCTYTHTGLVGGSTHAYVITDLNSMMCESNNSWPTVTATAPGPCGSCTPPPVPTMSLAPICTVGALTLTWNTTVGATGYDLYDTSSGAPVLVTTVPSSSCTVSTCSYTNVGLTQGSLHTYYVTASNAPSCNSVRSNIIAAFAPDVCLGGLVGTVDLVANSLVGVNQSDGTVRMYGDITNNGGSDILVNFQNRFGWRVKGSSGPYTYLPTVQLNGLVKVGMATESNTFLSVVSRFIKVALGATIGTVNISSANWRPPSPGDYDLQLCADSTGAVDESNALGTGETNNCTQAFHNVPSSCQSTNISCQAEYGSGQNQGQALPYNSGTGIYTVNTGQDIQYTLYAQGCLGGSPTVTWTSSPPPAGPSLTGTGNTIPATPPTHFYTSTGSVTETAKFTDNNGVARTATCNVTVQTPPPTPPPPSSVCSAKQARKDVDGNIITDMFGTPLYTELFDNAGEQIDGVDAYVGIPVIFTANPTPPEDVDTQYSYYWTSTDGVSGTKQSTSKTYTTIGKGKNATVAIGSSGITDITIPANSDNYFAVTNRNPMELQELNNFVVSPALGSHSWELLTFATNPINTILSSNQTYFKWDKPTGSGSGIHWRLFSGGTRSRDTETIPSSGTPTVSSFFIVRNSTAVSNVLTIPQGVTYYGFVARGTLAEPWDKFNCSLEIKAAPKFREF